MESYRLWVRQNRDFVHSLESLANGITWLLPERFSNSEIGPEAVYAALGIVTAVNQHIIDSAPGNLRPPSGGPDRSSFPWSLWLTVLKDVETVVEVSTEHFYGENGKWNFIFATEATKALVRLGLFRGSGYKMLLQGGEASDPEASSNYDGGGGYDSRYSHGYHGFNLSNLEQKAMSALTRFGEDAKMWLTRSQPVKLAERPTLSSIWNGKGLFGKLCLSGEMLFIMRPLVYVVLIRKYGIRSWRPWLISLAVDLTGMSVFSYASYPRLNNSRSYELSASEKDELKRRKLLWAFYLMRDPFFTKYTKKHLEKANTYLRPAPFIGFLTDKLVELIFGAQTRYTYTSAS